MDVLGHRLRYREAVVGAGAATDLVQDYEGSGSGVVQNRGGLDHLHHECRLAHCQIVLETNPAEYPVHEADSCGLGRDETADLGHQSYDGDLTDVSRLACHVWAGNQA